MSLARQPRLGQLLRLRVVVDEPVGQHHRPHLQPAVEQPLPRQVVQHRRAEPADRALLDGDQHLVVPRQLLHQRRIQRLGEARIGHRRRQPARRQLVGRLQRIPKPRPERQDRDAAALAQHASLAQRQHLAAGRQLPRPPRRRADSAAPTAGRRSPPRSPPRAPARPRPTAPSARSPAGSPDTPGRRLPECVAPSAPTGPARSSANRTGRPWIATSCTTWS